MTKPDVVLTDYLLAAESAVLAWLLSQSSSARIDLQAPFVALFASTAVAAAAGGTVHGFFETMQSAAGIVLWRTSLIAIGIASWCAWAIGAPLLLDPAAARALRTAAWVEFIVYAVVIVRVSDRFAIAMGNYLLPVLFLLAALGYSYSSTGVRTAALGIAGLLLAIAAAGLQQLKIGIHREYFDHNAVYHVLQGGSLFMIFLAARALVSSA